MKKISLKMMPEAAQVARVDRENGRIYGVSAMQIGPALGHGTNIDALSIEKVAELGNLAAKGVKVRFTHPGMCSDGLGKMLGRLTNFRVSEDKVLADFTASKSARHDLLEHIFSLAESDADAFGMSVVVTGAHVYKTPSGEVEFSDMPPADAEKDEYGEPMLFLRVAELYAVDFVDEPAANRDGLFSSPTTQQFAEWFKGTSSLAAADAFAVLDDLCDEYQLDAESIKGFVDSYVFSRSPVLGEHNTVAPAATNDKGVLMDIKEVQALSAKHPESANVILALAAEGKTEAEIINHVADLELSNAKSLAAQAAKDLEEKKAAFDKLSDELKEAQKQLADLNALRAGNDPGPDAATSNVVSKSDFLAMSGKARGEFLAAGGTIDEKGA